MTFRDILVGMLALVFAQASGFAQPIVYPAKGQSPQQQAKDEGDCYAWARNHTGVDPITAAGTQDTAPPQPPGRGALKGAIRGALGGAAVADIAGGHAGTGAAAGAVMGGIRGTVRQQKSAEQAAQQAQTSGMQRFQRAYGACLEGRGYTVR